MADRVIIQCGKQYRCTLAEKNDCMGASCEGCGFERSELARRKAIQMTLGCDGRWVKRIGRKKA